MYIFICGHYLKDKHQLNSKKKNYCAEKTCIHYSLHSKLLLLTIALLVELELFHMEDGAYLFDTGALEVEEQSWQWTQ